MLKLYTAARGVEFDEPKTRSCGAAVGSNTQPRHRDGRAPGMEREPAGVYLRDPEMQARRNAGFFR